MSERQQIEREIESTAFTSSSVTIEFVVNRIFAVVLNGGRDRKKGSIGSFTPCFKVESNQLFSRVTDAGLKRA